MKYSFFYCLLVAAVLARLATAALAVSNIYVAMDGDDTRNGADDWTNAVATISNGIAHANTAGDTVWVSNGTYVLSVQLSITRAITVSAWSASAADTSIDGDGAVRCVSISAAATLAGFTVSNGAVSGDGGGLSLANASCVVTNCIITRNQTTGGNGRGGGIYLAGGKVTDCIISHNVANLGGWPFGGGGLSCYSSYGLVENCQFISNVAYSSTSLGGGIGTYNVTPSLLVSNCVFDGNIASIGGGMGIYGSGCQIVDCALSNNMATNSYGGGVYLGGGVISNCVIARNQASGRAAGIEMSAGTGVNCVIQENLAYGYDSGGVTLYGTLLNSSVINNTNKTGTWGSSGGVYMRTGASPSILRNCLIAGNVITGLYGTGGVRCHDATVMTNSLVQNCTIVHNRGYYGGILYIASNSSGNIIYYNTGTYMSNWNQDLTYYISNSCTAPTNSNLVGAGNIQTAPQFIDTNNANYRLVKGSPCINTGLNQDWMTNGVDLDGRIRLRYGTVDIGCYEAVYSAFIFTAY